MDANELEACLYKGAPVLLDVRYRLGGPSGFEEYVERHIPGAHYVDLDTALAAPPDERGRHPLPDVAAFEAAMRAAGVCNDVPVVVYDDWSGRAAARCWWLLRWAGHTNVRVLDGGLGAWRGGVAQGSSPTAPGDFVARPGAMPQVDAEDVLAQSCLIHARAPSRFRGDEEPVDPVAGHIPGALNRPTDDNLTPEGTFKPAAELARLYEGLGGATVYCGSGVTACHDLLAMEVAGIAGKLFAPSWSGWITDRSRPIERSA